MTVEFLQIPYKISCTNTENWTQIVTNPRVEFDDCSFSINSIKTNIIYMMFGSPPIFNSFIQSHEIPLISWVDFSWYQFIPPANRHLMRWIRLLSFQIWRIFKNPKSTRKEWWNYTSANSTWFTFSRYYFRFRSERRIPTNATHSKRIGKNLEASQRIVHNQR